MKEPDKIWKMNYIREPGSRTIIRFIKKRGQRPFDGYSRSISKNTDYSGPWTRNERHHFSNHGGTYFNPNEWERTKITMDEYYQWILANVL